MTPATAHRLTATALTLAMDRADVAEAAAVLGRLAGDDHRAVEHALARVRRGLVQRSSPVGERAAHSLAAVLDDLDVVPRFAEAAARLGA